MKQINECIIIGGGASIKEGLKLELKSKIKDKFVIACNYAFKHFSNTLTCFVDSDFYCPSADKINSGEYINIYEDLKHISLIVGLDLQKKLEQKTTKNTIIVKDSKNHSINNQREVGFYRGEGCGGLCGIFALSLAEYLLNNNGIIFLLGFDWTRRSNMKENKLLTESHYYSDKEIPHRGQHYFNFYEKHNPNNLFRCFATSKLKIYNVSINSSIEVFPKISYQKMFDLLSHKTFEQESLRQQIKDSLQIN